MNSIEQIAEPKNGVLDIHVETPADWNGKKVRIRVELEEESAQNKAGTGLSRLRGQLRHLSAEQKTDMDRQLRELRDEWERPIS
ncbi:hypothetical protein GCM10023187_39240 [Nibrella viscosa]|uniref:Uncharacterized protein n=1 Tax=Nibrella viscosa TaxID=1084524 RepID=A0ABP8KP77_9BACT